ncbi:MAG: hypothetical protein U1F08_12100 [Steroidobacteraceae bacterium]
MQRATRLLLVPLACFALEANANASRSVAALAELTILGPARAQLGACASLHADQAQEAGAALNHLSSMVAESLVALGTRRPAELDAQAPEALFMHQQGLARLYEADSQALSAERCAFLARDVRSITQAEIESMVGDVVTQITEASKAYQQGMERALQ